jgi:hypothetical protein
MFFRVVLLSKNGLIEPKILSTIRVVVLTFFGSALSSPSSLVKLLSTSGTLIDDFVSIFPSPIFTPEIRSFGFVSSNANASSLKDLADSKSSTIFLSSFLIEFLVVVPNEESESIKVKRVFI